MALVKPAGLQQHTLNTARATRFAANPWVRNGVVADSHYAVTGDPGTLSVNVAAGIALLEPGRWQGDLVLVNDAPVNRSINIQSAAGSRNDLVGLQVWDSALGDATDDWDVVVVRGATGAGDPAAPKSAGWLPLARVKVQQGDKVGTDLDVTRLVSTVAVVRDGGFDVTDLAFPFPLPFPDHHRVTVGNGGIFTVHTSCPFTPRVTTFTPTSPMYYDLNIVATILWDRNTYKGGSYTAQAFRVDGAPVSAGKVIEFDALYVPDNP
jgi:hypothetical protein